MRAGSEKYLLEDPRDDWPAFPQEMDHYATCVSTFTKDLNGRTVCEIGPKTTSHIFVFQSWMLHPHWGCYELWLST